MPNIIIGPKIGEVVKDGKKIRDEYMVYCGRHNLYVKDPKKPTEEEKKMWEKALMKDYLLVDKDGMETRGKICNIDSCRMTVVTYKETKNETN